MKIWPWTKTVKDKGERVFTVQYFLGGEKLGGPVTEVRRWVLYEITNHWTGSVTLKEEEL